MTSNGSTGVPEITNGFPISFVTTFNVSFSVLGFLECYF